MSDTELTTKEEAVAALRAGAWTEHREPVYEHARDSDGDPVYLDQRGHVRWHTTASQGVAAPPEWRPLYLDVTPAGRQLVHCRMSFTGADWDLESAVKLVERADKVGWHRGMFGVVLAVLCDDAPHFFEVKRPDR